jgi:hypothetical protein
MSFANPTTEAYFCNVPFDSDYNNVMLFTSKDQQVNYFKSNYIKHYSNLNIIRKDTPFHIADDFGSYDTVNYIMYRNPELDSKWWFAFVTDVQYTATNTTRIVIQTDVWQSYLFDRSLRRSYIERGTVGNDTFGMWTAPEPIGFENSFERNCDDYISNKLLWDSHKYLNVTSLPYSTTGEWAYGGVPLDNVGSYLIQIDSADINELNKIYALYAGASGEHLNDILGITFAPHWIYTNATAREIPLIGSVKASIVIMTDVIQRTELIAIPTYPTFKNGYKPRNNKLYTSLGRLYYYRNYQGMSIPILPEYLNNSNGVLNTGAVYKGKAYDCENISLQIMNYGRENVKAYDVPYSLTIPAVFDQNQGLRRSYNQANATANVIGSVANIGLGVAETGASIAGGYAGGVASGIANVVSGAASLPANIISAKNSQGEFPISRGGTAGLFRSEAFFYESHLVEATPTVDELKQIDDFLTAYGYQINQFGDPDNWLHNRQRFDYLKTAPQATFVKCSGDSKDNEILRAIFSHGVHIWHSMDGFGSLQDDNPIV